MTAGHDGTPENDDPFAYLYRSEGGAQPEPAADQPRTPRTSYHQVQRVGERRTPYPPQQQPPQQVGGYGYPPQQGYDQGQAGYARQGQGYTGGPTQQYPQQQYAPAPQPPGGGHRGGGPAPNRKGLLIAAVAVVAAVAVGIAFAMTNGSGSDGKKQDADKATTAPPVTTGTPSTKPTPSATPVDFASGKVDAATLALAGGAQQSNQWPGADATNGTYVDHMAQAGASVTWTVNVPTDGPYTIFVSYGNAGADANLTLGINGKPRSDAMNLRNYGNYTDWSKAWHNHTYSWVDLKKGANTLSLTCGQGQQCGVNLDQVWLKQGQVTE
jgi:hypothetical protein